MAALTGSWTSSAQESWQGNPSRAERFELVAVAADEFARAIFDVGECAKSVVLQLEQIVGVIEGFGDPR
jgi:hypothetical protein